MLEAVATSLMRQDPDTENLVLSVDTPGDTPGQSGTRRYLASSWGPGAPRRMANAGGFRPAFSADGTNTALKVKLSYYVSVDDPTGNIRFAVRGNSFWDLRWKCDMRVNVAPPCCVRSGCLAE